MPAPTSAERRLRHAVMGALVRYHVRTNSAAVALPALPIGRRDGGTISLDKE